MLQNILTILTSPSNIDLAGFKFQGPAFLIVPVFFAFIFLAVSSVIWIFRDASQRRKNGFVAILFILCGWPLSLIWWLWLRPSLAFTHKIQAEQGAAANP